MPRDNPSLPLYAQEPSLVSAFTGDNQVLDRVRAEMVRRALGRDASPELLADYEKQVQPGFFARLMGAKDTPIYPRDAQGRPQPYVGGEEQDFRDAAERSVQTRVPRIFDETNPWAGGNVEAPGGPVQVEARAPGREGGGVAPTGRPPWNLAETFSGKDVPSSVVASAISNRKDIEPVIAERAQQAGVAEMTDRMRHGEAGREAAVESLGPVLPPKEILEAYEPRGGRSGSINSKIYNQALKSIGADPENYTPEEGRAAFDFLAKQSGKVEAEKSGARGEEQRKNIAARGQQQRELEQLRQTNRRAYYAYTAKAKRDGGDPGALQKLVSQHLQERAQNNGRINALEKELPTAWDENAKQQIQDELEQTKLSNQDLDARIRTLQEGGGVKEAKQASAGLQGAYKDYVAVRTPSGAKIAVPRATYAKHRDELTLLPDTELGGATSAH